MQRGSCTEIGKSVCKNDRDLMAIKNVSLDIHAGEILGIAGVAGNGQKELAEAVAGLRKSSRRNHHHSRGRRDNTGCKKHA